MNHLKMNDLKMKNRYEQVQCIGPEEMCNREQKLRQLMMEKEVDILLFLDGTWEGYTHWLTGSRRVDTAIVFLQEKMLVINSEDVNGIPYEDVRFEHIRYRREFSIEEISLGLGKKQAVRIGVVQPETMTWKMYQAFKFAFSKLEFCDCTQQVDVIKAVKSENELLWIAESNRIHEEIFRALPQIICRGKSIREINNETRYLGEKLGGGGEKALYYAMQYGRDDGSPLIYASGISDQGDYKVSEGDRLFMMIEGNGPGGLYTALGRNFVLGQPCDQTVKYWEMAVKAQDFAAKRMKPGTRLKDIFDENYQYITSMGFLTNQQNYLHSFGYVFGERPYLHDRSETETLKKGMHYIVHPHVRIDRGTETGKVPYDDYYCVDTYYVTEEGGCRANHFPRELVIL